MNENNSGMYDANSGYYGLPTKETWVCSKALYSAITIGSSILIGLIAAYLFVPWIFGNTAQPATGLTLIGAYYAIFALFSPFVLFCACIHGCRKNNRKLFGECKRNLYNTKDIAYAIQTICVTFLKTALIYCIIAILSSPIILIFIVLVAANSVFKIFKL